ncbi:Ger(x)C family spore germination C-terminal domain-containing protein [Bacillus sp. ISL-18]|uniref:Ger(x)C family spore germination C-terminal domain-containing protein n=1 Tax=Bacillus sp. ISL-18 TaxID=2819118 RepID=UPI001BE5A6F1|nr:Ger(x)C family spore germination C-terminal domain-containing protein [Bacillus sp. ISL-18]MBT2658238.1 Ger(x)C family spore germination C-terminal domain-containing protein [Bacillus sp. ISL-18]
MISLNQWKKNLLILLSCFVLSACGFKDIEKRFFVVSIGVDAAKDRTKKYLVSLKFAVPGPSKDSPIEYQIVSQEASLRLFESSKHISVNVSVMGTLEEASSRVPISKLSVYENTAEKQISRRFTKVLVKLQKVHVDPIGFGLRYHSRHFNDDDWEQWKKIYPNLVFKVHSKVQIEDPGLID